MTELAKATLVQDIDAIVERYGADKQFSLAILQDTQRACSYLPREALERIADRLDVSLGEVFRLATFFAAFSLEPKGKHVCKVCLGTACHVQGGPRILEALERRLHIKAGQTTPDGQFSLEAVRCLGACALAPILVVDEEPHAAMTPDKATRLIDKLDAGGAEQEETPSVESPARSSAEKSVPPTT